MSAANLEELGNVLLSLPTNGADVRIYRERGVLMVDISDCDVDALDNLIRYYYVDCGVEVRE